MEEKEGQRRSSELERGRRDYVTKRKTDVNTRKVRVWRKNSHGGRRRKEKSEEKTKTRQKGARR